MWASARIKRIRYDHRRWRKRSRQQLREHPLCAMCLKDGIVTPAYAADHIEPHRDNAYDFWHGALQSLCLTHHNVTKQRQEAWGFTSDVDRNGWPLDPKHPANIKN
jgi:hypothetical protein